jgi:hypothetical protein
VRHRLRLEPVADQGPGGRVHHQHRRPGALHHPLDLGPGEPPVYRVGDDPLSRAGPVQVEVGRVVLGQDAHPVAALDPEGRQPAGQLVDPAPELPERHRPIVLDHRGFVAVDRGPAHDHVVDGEGVDAQLSHRFLRL